MCEYTSYTPESLGGPGLESAGLWADDRRLSAASVFASMMHVQAVLSAMGRAKEAFPVLAILEHVGSLCRFFSSDTRRQSSRRLHLSHRNTWEDYNQGTTIAKRARIVSRDVFQCQER